MLWAFWRTLLAHCALVSVGAHGSVMAPATSSAAAADDRLFDQWAPLRSQLLCTFTDSQCWQTALLKTKQNPASNCEMVFCWGFTLHVLGYSEFVPYHGLPL